MRKTAELAEIDPEIYRRWLLARQRAEDWKRDAEALAEELAFMIGNAAGGSIDGEKVITRVSYEQTQFDQTRLKHTYPDLYNQFIYPRAVAYLRPVGSGGQS
jgi:hypothetical protein